MYMTCLQAAVYICIVDMYSTHHAPGAVSNVMLLIPPATHTSSRKCKGVYIITIAGMQACINVI